MVHFVDEDLEVNEAASPCGRCQPMLDLARNCLPSGPHEGLEHTGGLLRAFAEADIPEQNGVGVVAGLLDQLVQRPWRLTGGEQMFEEDGLVGKLLEDLAQCVVQLLTHLGGDLFPRHSVSDAIANFVPAASVAQVQRFVLGHSNLLLWGRLLLSAVCPHRPLSATIFTKSIDKFNNIEMCKKCVDHGLHASPDQSDMVK